MMEPLLVSPREAARVLGISIGTMYLWLKSGEVPSVRIGALIRVPVEGLRAFVEARSIRTRDESDLMV